MTNFAYIMSPSYSGSTLLTFLLNGHPAIATIGELKAHSMGDIERYRCSCGALIRACPFWQEMTEELSREGINFDVGHFGTHFDFGSRSLSSRLLRTRVRGGFFEPLRDLGLRVLPECRRGLARILERNRAVVSAIRRMRGATVFLDASKDPVRLKYLLVSRFWRIKVIWLLRDGRGVANSFMKHNGVSMSAAAFEWKCVQEECDTFVPRLPEDSWLKVHYEDLCRNPDEVLRAIFDFLELNPAEASRDLGEVEHHILGNSMRLRFTSEIVLDEKWRGVLSEEDLATFDRIAGALNRRCGYGSQPKLSSGRARP